MPADTRRLPGGACRAPRCCNGQLRPAWRSASHPSRSCPSACACPPWSASPASWPRHALLRLLYGVLDCAPSTHVLCKSSKWLPTQILMHTRKLCFAHQLGPATAHTVACACAAESWCSDAQVTLGADVPCVACVCVKSMLSACVDPMLPLPSSACGSRAMSSSCRASMRLSKPGPSACHGPSPNR